MKKQSGAAIIMALLITTIVASIATLLAFHERLEINTASLVFNQNKLYRISTQRVNQAIISLRQYGNQRLVDESLRPPPMMDGRLIDQNGLFNLNVLENTNNQYRFIQLLHAVIPQLASPHAIKLTETITARIDTSGELVSISQIRPLAGLTAKNFLTIAPYITALPSSRYQINPSSASVAVLTTLAPKLDLAQAKILRRCPIDEFTQCAQEHEITIRQNELTNASEYFLLQTQATIDRQTLNVNSLLYLQYAKTIPARRPETQPTTIPAQVTLLWQSQGGL